MGKYYLKNFGDFCHQNIAIVAMLNRFYFSLHFQGFKNGFTEIIPRLMSPLSHDKQNEKKKNWKCSFAFSFTHKLTCFGIGRYMVILNQNGKHSIFIFSE